MEEIRVDDKFGCWLKETVNLFVYAYEQAEAEEKNQSGKGLKPYLRSRLLTPHTMLFPVHYTSLFKVTAPHVLGEGCSVELGHVTLNN